ncbi:MAG: DNA recombination protein RmuC, partial [Pseudomonadota bacterium]
MEQPILLLGVLIVGVVLGGGAAWFFASRPVADLRGRVAEQEASAKELDEKFRASVTDLATMSERAARADSLATELDAARAENADFKAERAGFAEQKRLLEESRDKLLKEFENTGAQVLGKAQEAFLRRAEERFKQSEEAGEA